MLLGRRSWIQTALLAGLVAPAGAAPPASDEDWGPVPGTLVDAFGRPIAGVVIEAERVDSGAWRGKVLTDARGRFEWPWVDLRGSYALSLVACGLEDRGATLFPAPLRFEVRPLRLAVDVAQVEARAGGAPVRCVRVTGDLARPVDWGRCDVPARESGGWLLPRGEACVLLAWSPERGLAEMRVEFAGDSAPAASCSLELPPAGAPGRCSVRLGGATLPRSGLVLEVRAAQSRAVLATLPARGISGEAGWDLTLPAGRYLLRFAQDSSHWDPPLACALGAKLQSVPDACALELPLEIEAGAIREMRAEWPAGELATVRVAAAASAAVWRLDAHDAPIEPLAVVVDVAAGGDRELGRAVFEFPTGTPCRSWHALPLGRQRLAFAAAGCATRVIELDVVEGRPPRIDVSLERLR